MVGMLGYEVRGIRYMPRQLRDTGNLRSLGLDDVLCRRMVETRKNLSFMQVGAYDGVTRDPLHRYIARYGWSGVMIEPQTKAAARLRALYRGNDSIVVLQAAVDREPKIALLYTLDSTDLPPWAGGLASFDRACITKHGGLIPGIEDMIRGEDVLCTTFDDALARLPDPAIDLLQIDAEGADAYLLSLFPFERIKPAIVHWEVKHLGLVERESCLGRLQQFGYRFAPSTHEDMLAVQ